MMRIAIDFLRERYSELSETSAFPEKIDKEELLHLMEDYHQYRLVDGRVSKMHVSKSTFEDKDPPIKIKEWISVDEKLPELEEDVLLFDSWKTGDGKLATDMRVGYLDEVTIRKTKEGVKHYPSWAGDDSLFNITHWMPLPENPSS